MSSAPDVLPDFLYDPSEATRQRLLGHAEARLYGAFWRVSDDLGRIREEIATAERAIAAGADPGAAGLKFARLHEEASAIAARLAALSAAATSPEQRAA